jgi:hypothetical protein
MTETTIQSMINERKAVTAEPKERPKIPKGPEKSTVDSS